MALQTDTPALPPLIRIVDDNDTLRQSLEFMLQCEGYEVVSYASAMEFLKSVREKYDLVFLDPPYQTDLLETAIAHIARHDLLSVHGMMIAEHPVDKTLPTLSAPYRMGRTYRYGKIAVTIYHRDGDGEAEA